MNRSNKIFLLCAAAATLLAGPAEAALVLRSAGPSAPSYPPGKAIADATAIALKAGDVVTVLVANATRVLRGPGSFRLAGASKPGPGGFNARGRFGAMRAGEIPSSPSLWHVDVTQSGTVCVPPDGLKLWRPESEDAVTLAVAAPGGSTQQVPWAKGQDELAWPTAVPLAEGEEYRLTWTGNADPTRLKFARIASLPNDPAGLAQAFIDRGCQSQLDMFIDNTPVE